MERLPLQTLERPLGIAFVIEPGHVDRDHVQVIAVALAQGGEVGEALLTPGRPGIDEHQRGDLAPQFQQIARSAEVGSISTPVRTPLGLHLVAVCGRRVGGPEIPSRQEIEFRLRQANLSMLARRYMRDLRADALIELK